jgi:hypothetical protein
MNQQSTTTAMTKLHLNNGNPIATEPFSRTVPVTAASERCPIESERECAQSPNRSSHLNWTMLAIWVFVGIMFAAFIFCFWVISARCRGDWTF